MHLFGDILEINRRLREIEEDGSYKPSCRAVSLSTASTGSYILAVTSIKKERPLPLVRSFATTARKTNVPGQGMLPCLSDRS